MKNTARIYFGFNRIRCYCGFNSQIPSSNGVAETLRKKSFPSFSKGVWQK